MATENYIEHANTGDYKTYLDPIISFDLTYSKDMTVIPVASDPEDGEAPQTGLGDFKQIIKKVTINFIITDDSNNPDTVAQRIAKLENLYGYATDQTNTQVKFHYDGTDYEGAMNRYSATRNGGEPFYSGIIEITLGVNYDEIT